MLYMLGVGRALRARAIRGIYPDASSGTPHSRLAGVYSDFSSGGFPLLSFT